MQKPPHSANAKDFCKNITDTNRGACIIRLMRLRVSITYIQNYTPNGNKSKDGIMYNFNWFDSVKREKKR